MECSAPFYVQAVGNYVPCGKCVFCAATKRSDWALRLQYEAKMHYGSKFVTLTYSDKYLPKSKKVGILVKRHLQLFFKRLRFAGHKFRYYGVGEYGSKTLRPHYHVIIFGDVPEMAIRKAWSLVNRKNGSYSPIGLVHIGAVNPASINYALGYLVNGKGGEIDYSVRPRPFSLMSRGRGKMKGLGYNYLTPEMIHWHRSDRRNYAQIYQERRHLPRYYKEKIFSKIDLVRIAVKAQKETFKKMVDFIRSPMCMKMRDPLAYYDERRRMLGQKIRFKSKENLTI